MIAIAALALAVTSGLSAYVLSSFAAVGIRRGTEFTGRTRIVISCHRVRGSGDSAWGAIGLLVRVGDLVLAPINGTKVELPERQRLQITSLVLSRARVGAITVLICATAPLWVASVASGVFAVTFSLGAGYILPPLLVAADRRRLNTDIHRFLPEATEMLVMGVQAGVAFDRAMRLYCDHFNNRVASVFGVILENFELGLSRAEALSGARGIVGDEIFSNWAEAVERADKLGTPLASTMTAQAAETRRRRSEWVETQAAKAPIKMLFPLVVLVMPALFVMLLGPVLIKMFQGRF